mgnify:CR=1 FL=1
MKKQTVIKREDGININATYSSRAGSKSIIILVHGFPKADNKDNNLFQFLAEEIPTYAASTLLFDYSSCDYTSGETEDFTIQSAGKDLEAIYIWAERMGYENFGIIAEGLGAPIMLSRPPENTILSILFWPALDLEHVKKSLFRANEHTKDIQTQGWFEYDNVKIGQELVEELNQDSAINDMERFNAPTLILHGEKDTVFPALHIDVAREHLMARRLEITTLDGAGAGLSRASDRKCCLMHINQFLLRYIEQ